MKNFTNPLDNVRVASPCSQDWNAMIDDDRQRFCGDCKLNVYNLSGMTRAEAESLLINSEGRLCVRFYRRADGTILTQDCPVGWQAFKKRVSRRVTAFASLIFGFISGLGLMSLFEKKEPVVMGAVAYQPVVPVEKIEPTVGEVVIPQDGFPLMEEPAIEVKGDVDLEEFVGMRVAPIEKIPVKKSKLVR